MFPISKNREEAEFKVGRPATQTTVVPPAWIESLWVVVSATTLILKRRRSFVRHGLSRGGNLNKERFVGRGFSRDIKAA
jgi:hypothetical protein